MKNIFEELLLLGLCLLSFGPAIQAQTPDTNDVATAWNVQFNYSTNQKTAVIWTYRNYTNAIPPVSLVGTNLVTNSIPDLTTWHRDWLKGVAGRAADDYQHQRQDALSAAADIQLIRAALPDCTQAQLDQIKLILKP